jgi:hypothetical protein
MRPNKSLERTRGKYGAKVKIAVTAELSSTIRRY